MHLAITGVPMRAAAIVVAVVVVSTPSHASKSCMTKAEARAQFATSHLYWHGPDHCWDANAPRHGLVHRIKPSEQREAQVADEQPKEDEPKWRDAHDAMPEVRTDQESAPAPVFRAAPPAVWAYDDSASPSTGLDWLDRWVEITQVVPSVLLANTPEPVEVLQVPGGKIEPMVTPTRVIFAFLALVLTIAVIELVFRSTIRER